VTLYADALGDMKLSLNYCVLHTHLDSKLAKSQNIALVDLHLKALGLLLVFEESLGSAFFIVRWFKLCTYLFSSN